MYFLFGILVLISFVFVILFSRRKKKKILCRLACMNPCEKENLLNSLLGPLGFYYESRWDVISSRTDAWQKAFGYLDAYNRAAPYLSMVFDSYPIYFDYEGRTWLVQIWKGQYGICTGCEIGLYYADGLVKKSDYKKTLFHAAGESDWLDMSVTLWKDGKRITSLDKRHWWLTVFDPGNFSRPQELSMDVSVHFQNYEFGRKLCEALIEGGIKETDIFWSCRSIFFHVPEGSRHFTLWQRFVRSVMQFKNRVYCRLFRFLTRCVCTNLDRILYLYFYLPRFLRHLLRHFSKQLKKVRRCR